MSETRFRDLEEKIRLLEKRMDRQEVLLERAVRSVLAVKSILKKGSSILSASGELLPPTPPVHNCGDSNCAGQGISVYGKMLPCRQPWIQAKKDFEKAKNLYSLQQATIARRQRRDELAAKRASGASKK